MAAARKPQTAIEFEAKFVDIVLSVLGIIQALALGDLASKLAKIEQKQGLYGLLFVIPHIVLGIVVICRIFQTYLLAAFDYKSWRVKFVEILTIFVIGILQYWIFEALDALEDLSAARFHGRLVVLFLIASIIHFFALRTLKQERRLFATDECHRRREIVVQTINVVLPILASAFCIISYLSVSQFVEVAVSFLVSLVGSVNIAFSLWATMSESYPDTFIQTETAAGDKLYIREMQISDARNLNRLICNRDFSMPVITGKLNRNSYISRHFASIKYVIAALASRFLGRAYLGARRHWLLAIERAPSGEFVGVVIIDGLVRFDPVTDPRRYCPFLDRYKNRYSTAVGDGEIGFFISPNERRRGIAFQALYAAVRTLNQEGALLRRIWAQTGDSNGAARGLLEKFGLVYCPDLSIPAESSPRFADDGTPLALAHYGQTPEELATANPVAARIVKLEQFGVVVTKVDYTLSRSMG